MLPPVKPSGAHQLCHQLCQPPLRQLPQPPFRHPPLRHQLPQASCCSPGRDLTASPAMSETAWRMTASRSPTGDRCAAGNRESAGCCAASPGAAAASSRDTPTAPAGMICKRTRRYLSRNDTRATFNGTLSRRVSDKIVTAVKLVRAPAPLRSSAPKAATDRGFGQRPGNPVHALRAGNRRSSGTR
jgi:hypothetical protein